MNSDRLRECFAILGWSQREAAYQLQHRQRALRQMAAGSREIPETLATDLERMVASIEAQPARHAVQQPQPWRD